ncbi:MAG TPA: spermidine N1-acetyltransferase [Porphyromonadaceae bacterium]|jgi:diamine N-acetyltransferase|uniref:spermidine N1-acetyltransferase n=1 Tax=Limibacterium fermenti TaxID=3229863 RepID=UPI000E7F4C79|nr:spermidine N1-acetyltransferase [Porphyromonadaceae bacterium]HBK30637.1 spermidine N1-acetyltransferase [Porphyromonadaceae bacterium]HBL34172.1 spermidine N1-acetyltransferase [Porphyromonadaceae bacterium]HBX19568.1 spermidine N1-acetyltransferase [Porphyromonadaceae bacterium]HBX46194.1 spermidine N1-acetyltransferase [Porphyromonadaceae bacterium]
MSDIQKIKIRPLERGDLLFVHLLDNNANIMRYWFEEPFFSLDELTQIYDLHILDQAERRFIVEDGHGIRVGLVELIDINTIHRNCEFQIIIAPEYEGKGYAQQATKLALEYSFKVLNMHKVFLYADPDNAKAVYIYEKCHFKKEGLLKEAFYVNGKYRDALIMALLRSEFLSL